MFGRCHPTSATEDPHESQWRALSGGLFPVQLGGLGCGQRSCSNTGGGGLGLQHLFDQDLLKLFSFLRVSKYETTDGNPPFENLNGFSWNLSEHLYIVIDSTIEEYGHFVGHHCKSKATIRAVERLRDIMESLDAAPPTISRIVDACKV